MAKNVFSVPIFIIVFRETLEAAIIVSVLLSLVEQLVTSGTTSSATPSNEATRNSDADSKDATETPLPTALVEDDSVQRRRLLRRMRIQVNHLMSSSLSGISFTSSPDIPWCWFRSISCPRHRCCVRLDRQFIDEFSDT
jgi:high-affinity Fe2+/Pb2+ permease